MNLNLTPEIEQYLSEKAIEQGVSTEAFTVQLLSESIAAKEKQAKLSALIQSWLQEDAEEQKETGAFLFD